MWGNSPWVRIPLPPPWISPRDRRRGRHGGGPRRGRGGPRPRRRPRSAPSSCVEGVGRRPASQRTRARRRSHRPRRDAGPARRGPAAGTWRLDDCTVVVTLEPCPMCAGALVGGPGRPAGVRRCRSQGRRGRQSLYNLCADPRLNHEVEVDAGVMAERGRRPCSASSSPGARGRPLASPPGRMPERTNGTASKAVVVFGSPWVRIPLLPLAGTLASTGVPSPSGGALTRENVRLVRACQPVSRSVTPAVTPGYSRPGVRSECGEAAERKRVQGVDGSFTVAGKAANGEGSLYREANGAWRATYRVPGESRPRRVRGRTRDEAPPAGGGTRLRPCRGTEAHQPRPC